MTARAQRIIASLNAPAPAIRYEIDPLQITEKYRARHVQLELDDAAQAFLAHCQARTPSVLRCMFRPLLKMCCGMGVTGTLRQTHCVLSYECHSCGADLHRGCLIRACCSVELNACIPLQTLMAFSTRARCM